LGLTEIDFPRSNNRRGASDGKKAEGDHRFILPSACLYGHSAAGESGLQVVKELKAKCPDTDVAVLTSYDLPEYEKAALQLGASHYFVKTKAGRSSVLELRQNPFLRPVLT